MIRVAMAAGLAVLAGACAAAGIEGGDTLRPVTVPEAAIPCAQAGLRVVKKFPPHVPVGAGDFLYRTLQNGGVRADQIRVDFDVTPTGETANIRYAGPKELMEHGTMQQLISATGDAISQWRFAWPGTPGYATACPYQVNYVMDRGKDD